MNLVVAALLDIHAKIAAENRGEKPQPQAESVFITKPKDKEDAEEDNREVRIQDKQKQR